MKQETPETDIAQDSGGQTGGGRKKPGRVPGPPTVRYTVLLEEELGEWAKRQPGDLSEVLRRPQRQAKDGQEGAPC